jgi:Beta-lactamase class C and other penicillin binding proteins
MPLRRSKVLGKWSLLAISIFNALTLGVLGALEDKQTIDLAKINPATMMTGPYSYFVPPYSYYYFHNMDKLGFKLDWVRRSGSPYPLKDALAPFTVNYTFENTTYTLDQYFERNGVLGFLILKDNQIIAERYFHGANVDSRFLSNSVQKSMTSTLVGVAVEEGKIASLEDPVTKYLPDFKDSGFGRVNLKNLLVMATGIEASENGLDPNSSIHQFNISILRGVPSFSDYLKTLKANPKIMPGTVLDYESVNTEVLGLALEKATETPLNAYMQAKLWSKIGAQSDAFIFRAQAQPDQAAFGCFCATLRDYGRFGLMAMNGGILDSERVVSASWMKEATTPRLLASTFNDGQSLSYGYQWWIPSGNEGAFEAMGIYGQIVYVNPAKHLVIVLMSAWSQPDNDASWEEARKMVDAVVSAIP